MLPVRHSPVMPHPAAAPIEADAPRLLARAITHAQIPATLKLLLLALLAAFSVAGVTRRALRRPRKDWYPSPELDAAEHPDSLWDDRALRKIRRQRAWIGWILRCAPNEGLSLSGHRAPAPCPAQAARAPPWRIHAPNPPKSVAKTPRPAAMTHALRRAGREADPPPRPNPSSQSPDKILLFLKKKEAKKTSSTGTRASKKSFLVLFFKKEPPPFPKPKSAANAPRASPPRTPHWPAAHRDHRTAARQSAAPPAARLA